LIWESVLDSDDDGDWEEQLRKADKKDKQKEYQRNYRERNKEKLKERRRSYYEQNLEKVKDRKRAYRERNLEKEKERERKYRSRNQEKVKERKRAYRERNLEKEKERRRIYYEQNREKVKKIQRTYKKDNLMCRTCEQFRVEKRGTECAGCGGYRVNSAEYELRDYIREWWPTTVFDKTMPGSCNAYRPDALIETPWGILIVECDENSHLHEAASCETIREYNIWQSLGCDVTFIRYNPDSFKPDNFATQRLSKEERLGALFLTIQEACETYRPGLHVQYLFYSPARIAELNAERNKLPV
jgi:hypothetical protein